MAVMHPKSSRHVLPTPTNIATPSCITVSTPSTIQQGGGQEQDPVVDRACGGSSSAYTVSASSCAALEEHDEVDPEDALLLALVWRLRIL
jgi:hypothetical protein